MKFDGERNRAEELAEAVEDGEPARFLRALERGKPWRPSALADLVEVVGMSGSGPGRAGTLAEEECVECLDALFAAGARAEKEGLESSARWASPAARMRFRSEFGTAALGSFASLAQEFLLAARKPGGRGPKARM